MLSLGTVQECPCYATYIMQAILCTLRACQLAGSGYYQQRLNIFYFFPIPPVFFAGDLVIFVDVVVDVVVDAVVDAVVDVVLDVGVAFDVGAALVVDVAPVVVAFFFTGAAFGGVEVTFGFGVTFGFRTGSGFLAGPSNKTSASSTEIRS